MADRFPEGAFPVFLEGTGSGTHVWDVDGNEYIDWICGLGAITLGYGRHTGMLEDTPELGAFSLPTTLEVEVAEKLVDLIPCAEMVRFTKTGSEAAEGAIRVARAYTGRDVILTCGYHSWHSWYAASKSEHPGVPESMVDLVAPFKYNNMGDFLEAMSIHEGNVAAVIIEPTLIDAPLPGFLEYVEALTRKAGAVLIFDEMVTGFRWHKSGYQAVCGITPDLAIFGKGMGNGYPIACLLGRRALMEEWGRLVSGTFGGDTVGLAAASTVIDVYNREDVCGRMLRRGQELFGRFGENLKGQPYHPVWNFGPKSMAIFLQETAKRGVLYHPGGFNVSAALTDEDMNKTRDATYEAISMTWANVPLEGKLPSPHPFRSTT